MMIAHITDTHLGYRQYNLEEREEDIYRLFNEAVEKILREKPDIVVHTGDLFDQPRPPVRALLVAYNGFKKLVDKGIRVYGILGDHDSPKRRSTPPHKLLEELGVIRVVGFNPFQEKPYMELDVNGRKVLLAGTRSLPKKYSANLIGILGKLGEVAKKYHRSILMLHQGIKEHFPFSYELELKNLPEGFNYYALGHIHMRTWFRYKTGIVGYAGSIDIIRIDEWEDYQRNGKGFYLVDLSHDKPVVHKVDLEGVRKHIILETDYQLLEEELRKLSQRIGVEELKPILHLTVRGKRINKANVHRLLLRVLQNKVLSWRLRFEEEGTPPPPSIVKGLEKIDVRELLKRSLGDEEEAELAYRLLELLGEGDTRAALELTKKYYEEKW